MSRVVNGGPVLSCENLGRTFREGGLSVDVFEDVSFSLDQGQRAVIIGASGAGKSTLLHLLGGLDKPTTGRVFVDGQEMSALSNRERGRLRNRALGFVYQFHHLLREFTALENVAMPLLIRGDSVKSAREQAAELLTRVGLGERLRHKPGELSGGERQRTAVARALITRPKCVLADEPTGNLDERTAEGVFALMDELHRELATSYVIVTHDKRLTAGADSVWTLHTGRFDRTR